MGLIRFTWDERTGTLIRLTDEQCKTIDNAAKLAGIDSLYVMHAEGTSLYKVGVSRQPEKRLAQVQTGCPHSVALARVYTPEDAYATERALHDSLAHCRTNGEWFDFSYTGVVNAAFERVGLEALLIVLYLLSVAFILFP